MDELQGYSSSSESSLVSLPAEQTGSEAITSVRVVDVKPHSVVLGKRDRAGAPADSKPNKRRADYLRRPPGGLVQLPSAAALLAELPGISGLEPGEDPDPAAKHQGRVRSFPHIEGNWPTHVYVAVTVPSSQRKLLSGLLQKVKDSLPALQPIVDPSLDSGKVQRDQHDGAGFTIQSQYHLSLSRTVPIRRHQIDPLVTALRQLLRKQDSFRIELGGLETFTNDDHSRSFLAVGVTNGRTPVCQAIRCVDAAFEAHGLQPFYAEPRPHLSVAWLLGSIEETLKSAADAAISEASSNSMGTIKLHWVWQVQSIDCRVGNMVLNVWTAAESVQ